MLPTNVSWNLVMNKKPEMDILPVVTFKQSGNATVADKSKSQDCSCSISQLYLLQYEVIASLGSTC